MKYTLAGEVEREIEEAVAFYDARLEGLGDGFLDEFDAAIERVVSFPEAWTPISPTLRRHILNRFPFSIVYSVEQDQILILALMHMQQKPRHW